jgi:hypothetical protein
MEGPSKDRGGGKSKRIPPEYVPINQLCPFMGMFPIKFSTYGPKNRSSMEAAEEDFRISIPGDNEGEKYKIHIGNDWSHQNIYLTSALVRIVGVSHNWCHCP